MHIKKELMTRLTIVVVVALLITTFLLVSSNFNLLDFLIKLHGG